MANVREQGTTPQNWFLWGFYIPGNESYRIIYDLSKFWARVCIYSEHANSNRVSRKWKMKLKFILLLVFSTNLLETLQAYFRDQLVLTPRRFGQIYITKIFVPPSVKQDLTSFWSYKLQCKSSSRRKNSVHYNNSEKWTIFKHYITIHQIPREFKRRFNLKRAVTVTWACKRGAQGVSSELWQGHRPWKKIL